MKGKSEINAATCTFFVLAVVSGQPRSHPWQRVGLAIEVDTRTAADSNRLEGDGHLWESVACHARRKAKCPLAGMCKCNWSRPMNPNENDSSKTSHIIMSTHKQAYKNVRTTKRDEQPKAYTNVIISIFFSKHNADTSLNPLRRQKELHFLEQIASNFVLFI
jgi:hypothetical protein